MRRSSMPCVWSAWSCVYSTPSSASAAHAEQLLAQIGRGVDQHRRVARAWPRRSTSSAQRRRRFFGFRRIAGAPHRRRRAARRRKSRSRGSWRASSCGGGIRGSPDAAPCRTGGRSLSVVAAASSSGDMPFTCASVARGMHDVGRLVASCRDRARAPGTARRSRPAGGRAARDLAISRSASDFLKVTTPVNDT